MKRSEFGKALVGGFVGAATVNVVNSRPVQANDSPPPRKKAIY